MLSGRIRTDGFVDPCIPSRAPKPPSGPDWVHEIKHDGYRLLVRRDGATVRLFTRRGYDWTDRYPAIANAAGKLKARSFTLDGEAVVCGADGVALFDALHRRGHIHDAILQAFDLLELCAVGPMTPRRFPPPWTVVEHPESFWVQDASPTFPTGALILEFCRQKLNLFKGRYTKGIAFAEGTAPARISIIPIGGLEHKDRHTPKPPSTNSLPCLLPIDLRRRSATHVSMR
jgi:ATP dependent DNA ligase domain